MRTGYSLLIEDTIIVTCCVARKKALKNDPENYKIKVMTCSENSAVPLPHCHLWGSCCK